METLLPYEYEIIEQALADDTLNIIARGLCLERIFAHMLKAFCVKTNLVLVVNATKEDIICFKEYLRNAPQPPFSLTTETTNSVSERMKIYKSGGVLFVTSRILILDFLTNRIPVDFVTAVLIYRAERLALSHQEAFITRLYREKNSSNGRVCAFSEVPTAFMSAHGKADRIMRMCNLKRLNIWPRFRSSISKCFDAAAPQVFENQSKLTPLMLKIQGNVLELIKACCGELKRENPSIDPEEFSVESVLSYDFERQLRTFLDPVTFSVSKKSKQLLTDLKTLRGILTNLLQRDCVSFYQFINEIRKNEEVFTSNTGWLFLKEADCLFSNAKERIFGSAVSSASSSVVAAVQKDKPQNKQANSSDGSGVNKNSDDAVGSIGKNRSLEENPKWSALKEIMKEIGIENEKLTDKSKGRVFVGVRDFKTSEMLRHYLYNGTRFLQEACNKIGKAGSGGSDDLGDNGDGDVGDLVVDHPTTTTSCSSDVKTLNKDVKIVDTANLMKKNAALKNQKLISEFIENDSTTSSAVSNDAETGNVLQDILSDEILIQRDIEPITVFHSYRSSYNIVRNLYKLNPRYIILYDPQVDFVRQVEVYAASVKTPIRVYFMVYKDSVEEQSFLISLQKEKLAFDKLMQDKSSMVVTDRGSGGRNGQNRDPYDSTFVSTRKGGESSVEIKTEGDVSQCPRVIVDMREFRSDLPPMLHQRGIDIEPVTLEVGDYLLSDDLCVERKSLSDLIGSLNSGRLYTQVTSMCRLYKKPILLIEFDPTKPFNMSDRGKLSQEVSINDIQTRIALLTVHFPALKIVWSEGAQQTANLFADLKHKRPEPDVNKLPGVESAENSIFDISFHNNFNFASRDLINKLPGLNSRSETLIFDNFENFQHLANSSEEEIREKTTRSDVAGNIYEFFNYSHKSTIVALKNKHDPRKPPQRFRPARK